METESAGKETDKSEILRVYLHHNNALTSKDHRFPACAVSIRGAFATFIAALDLSRDFYLRFEH